MLARKRPTPCNPKARSSSHVSSNVFFCASVNTLYERDFDTSAVSGGSCRGCKWPLTRTCGGLPIDRCRSEPPRSSVVWSKSGRFIGSTHASNDGFAHDFFKRCHAFAHLAQAALTKRDHPFFHRDAAQLRDRRVVEHHLSKR